MAGRYVRGRIRSRKWLCVSGSLLLKVIDFFSFVELPFLFLNPWKLKSSVIVSRVQHILPAKASHCRRGCAQSPFCGTFPWTEVLSQFLVAPPGQDARSPAFRYLRLVHGCGTLQLGGIYSRSSPSLSVIKEFYDGKSGSWKVGGRVAVGLREMCTKRPFPACLRAVCRFPWLVCTYS